MEDQNISFTPLVGGDVRATFVTERMNAAKL